jgi:hypothetical protein
MKLALVFSLLLLSSLARAESIGWVDSAKLDAGATEVARFKAHVAGKSPEQAQQIRNQAKPEITTHLRDAAAKVKAEKRLSIVVSDPLAADPKAEVTADVLKLWNAADQAGVAQENARLTARVAQLEAAALTKPVTPSVPAPPPSAPQPLASTTKGKK